MGATRRFRRAVIDPIRVGIGRPDPVGYYDYLDLPPERRAGDEADFVDRHFVPNLLHWLGYRPEDWTYNRQDGPRGRPDFVVHPLNVPAFVIESANTTKPFGREDLLQLRRYTAGTQGYALWTNGRTILGMRFNASGSYEILVRVDADDRQLDIEDTDASFGLLELLFSRNRFAEMRDILERISIPEDEWLEQARPLDNEAAQRAFINESRDLLDQLTTAARAAIDRAEIELENARRDLEDTVNGLRGEVDRLLDRLALPDARREELREAMRALVANPLAIDDVRLQNLEPAGLRGEAKRDWQETIRRILATVVEFRQRQLSRLKSQQVHDSFQIWKERYKAIEGRDTNEHERRLAYAEQVAYAFFVRLLLARILEDRNVIERLISDGGLKRWREVVDPQRRVKNADPRLHSEALLEILFQAVSVYYRHFFDQPVFDWFLPDDYLLALCLERLGTFSFREINRDILGYTYEAYVERAFRNEKGHFLTRGEVVDYILDQVGYNGPQIIGRSVFDPALGSGSFLVHAARRLRQALETAGQERGLDRAAIARQFIERLQEDFVGFEINPFSCYLAELNLLIQALDDLVHLWKTEGKPVAIERFRIYNTNSLHLPAHVLQQVADDLGPDERLRLDPAAEVKMAEGSFDFVVMNPPYLNRGILTGLEDLSAIPFYNAVFGGGDINYYYAFIRLANHFVRPGGRVGIIVPLNLFGDMSAGQLRRWLAAPLAGPAPNGLREEFRLLSLTRFYSRRVLFDDVLQGVCVCAWQREPAPDLEWDCQIEVAGGWSIQDARDNRIRFPADQVIRTDPYSRGLPVSDSWFNAWAVVPDPAYLRVWEQIRDVCVTDLRQWARNAILFRKGDINITRTRPLRLIEHGGRVGRMRRPVPTTGSKDIEPFGPYTVTGQLDAEADTEAMGLPQQRQRDAERERVERVLRIAELQHEEVVFVLKDIAGIEPVRPITGALYTRGPKRRICFEDTVQVAFATQPAYNVQTAAAFALLVSSVSNFILSLFSTNVHVTTNEIQRLPLPPIDERMMHRLAELAWDLQARGEQYHELRSQLDANKDDVASPTRVLELSNLPTETLETAVIRGDVEMPMGDPRHISTLLERGQIRASDEDGAYQQSLRLLLGKINAPYAEVAREVRLPRRDAAERFIHKLQARNEQLRNALDAFHTAMARVDRAVLELYGIQDPAERRLIGLGMPWAATGREFARGVVERLERVEVAAGG